MYSVSDWLTVWGKKKKKKKLKPFVFLNIRTKSLLLCWLKEKGLALELCAFPIVLFLELGLSIHNISRIELVIFHGWFWQFSVWLSWLVIFEYWVCVCSVLCSCYWFDLDILLCIIGGILFPWFLTFWWSLNLKRNSGSFFVWLLTWIWLIFGLGWLEPWLQSSWKFNLLNSSLPVS